jgi:hypothetical protein
LARAGQLLLKSASQLLVSKHTSASNVKYPWMQNHCAQRSYVDSSLQGDQWVATLYHVLISSLQPSKKYHPQPREPCPHHTHTSPSLTQSTSHIAPSPHRQSDPRQQPFAMHASSPCPNRAYSSAYILVPLFLAISIGGKVP